MGDYARNHLNLTGNISSGVKLPQIEPKINEMAVGGGDGKRIHNSKAAMMPFNKTDPTTSIHLPTLGIQKIIKPWQNSMNTHLKVTNPNSSISSGRLTKQEVYSREVAGNLFNNKASDRLSMDIDKKISSVGQSIAQFEKKYRSVNESIHDAVRRSAADSMQNRTLMSSHKSPIFLDGENSESYEKYLDILHKEDAEETETPPSPRVLKKIFGLDTMALLESGSSGSSSSSDSNSSTRKKWNTKHKKMKIPTKSNRDDTYYENSPRSLSPIMTNLTDKAFLTKLKKREGQASRNVKQIQNRVSSIQQKIESDKKKAKLDESKKKPLYKPRPDGVSPLRNYISANKGQRAEVIEFVQSSGGKTGSWKSDDHYKFIKAYETWRSQPDKIIEMTMKEVKNKSAKDVMEHFKWYEEYESLTKVHSDQLRKWDIEKRPEREKIYLKASEGQRSKLEIEKRRQEHLKSKRLEERLRGRESLSEWKKSKITEDESFDLNSGSNFNMDNLQKEMLELADKIQSMNKPNAKKLKPSRTKTFSTSALSKKYSSDALEFEKAFKSPWNEHHKSLDSKQEISINLPTIESNHSQLLGIKKSNKKEHSSVISEQKSSWAGELLEPKAISIAARYRKQQSSPTTTNSRTEQESINKNKLNKQHNFMESKLTEETYSHKKLKETQKCKRMELISKQNRIPNRAEESDLWNISSSFHSTRSKKGVPDWRKSS